MTVGTVDAVEWERQTVTCSSLPGTLELLRADIRVAMMPSL